MNARQIANLILKTRKGEENRSLLFIVTKL